MLSFHKSSFLKIFQKAMLTSMVFLLSEPVWAAKIETYKDVIDKAYTLTAQKDRTQALLILSGSLKKEAKKNNTAQLEIVEAIDKISSTFLSEKSQQIYETGMSLVVNDPNLAQSKFLEALRAEPQNILILAAYIRGLLANNDCNQAESELQKTEDLLGSLELHTFLEIKVDLCQSRYDAYSAAMTKVDPKKSNLNDFWPLMAVEYEYKYNRLDKALQKLDGLLKAENINPESYYWKAFVLRQKKQKDEPSMQKYLSICKSLSARQVRRFFYEPLLCRRVTEVESWLKTNDN